jgi:hypothetical protein
MSYKQSVYGNRETEGRPVAWHAGHARSQNIDARPFAWVCDRATDELNGWITGEWGLSGNNRRARFYKLTPDGRKQLTVESARYRLVTGAVAGIMGFA